MRLVAFALAPLLIAGCARTYHPEYHPETSYTYAQTITNVQNTIYGSAALPSSEPEANVGATPPEPPPDVEPESGRCAAGRASPCWRACYRDADGHACAVLAAMFERGDSLGRDLDDARRLFARACDLGDCGLPRPAVPAQRGRVTAPGTVIVYGNFSGSIYVGR